MNNKTLKLDVKEILSQKRNIKITKSEVSGFAINVENEKTLEDIGTYLYYGNEIARDGDYEELQKLTNE